MALGRITGGMLSAELARVTTDIKFSSSGSTNLLHLDATNDRVGIDKDPTVPLDVTGAIASTTTITGGTSVIGGTCTVAAGSITDSSGAISFSNENLSTTGTFGSGIATLASSSTVGNLTLGDGSITDSSGAISFGNENLSTTGTFGSGIATLASSSTVGNLTLGDGSIVDSSGAISFGNENLTTTGQINTSGVRLLENEITTIRSNDDLVLSANGTGGVQVEGSLTVSADLTVNGSTTTVNSTTLTVDDKNIELAHSPSGASASDTLADGGGIILKGSTDHTILWTNATDDWDFTDSIDIASGKTFKIAGTTVVSGTNVTVATGTFSGAVTVGSVTVGGDGATVTGIKDEDNMASDSAVKLATQQSIKAYVDAAVATADTFLELSDTPGSYTASAILATNAAGNAVASAELLYTVSSNDITLANGTSNKDIIFQVNDGGSGTEVARFDGDVSAFKMASGKQVQYGAAEEYISGDGTDMTLASGADFIFAGTGGASNLLLPSGTTAQRAGTDVGQMRYNTTTGSFEGYSASGWGGIGGGDLTIVDDSSTTVTVALADDSVLFSGGANITTSISGNSISIALDGALTGLTAVTVDNLNIDGNTITATSGDITLAPAGSGDVNIGANLGLTFGDDGEKIEGDGTDLTIASSALLNLTATTDVVIPADVGLLFGSGGEKIESNGTNLTATVTGNMEISGTTGLVVPSGTTGERPSVANGLIRYNSTLGSFEGCTDGSTYVQFVTATTGQAADINKDVFTTQNASTTDFALSYSPAEANNIIVYVDNIMQEPTQNFTLSGSTMTLTSAPHSGARVIVMHGFDSSGGVAGASWVAGSNTDVDSAIENVDSFTTATFSSAEYSYMAKNAEGTGDSTTGYEAGKIIVVNDGTTAQMTQYGITHTSTAPLLTFSVDIDSGSVRLRAASIAANTKIKFARLGFAPF